MARKLKIVSDGTPHNTHVVDVETGEELDMVQSVSWDCSTESGASMATIVVRLAGIEAYGEVED